MFRSPTFHKFGNPIACSSSLTPSPTTLQNHTFYKVQNRVTISCSGLNAIFTGQTCFTQNEFCFALMCGFRN